MGLLSALRLPPHPDRDGRAGSAERASAAAPAPAAPNPAAEPSAVPPSSAGAADPVPDGEGVRRAAARRRDAADESRRHAVAAHADPVDTRGTEVASGNVTHTRTRSTERVMGDGYLRRSEADSTRVAGDSVTHTRTRRTERETADGRTHAIEQSSGVTVGAGGVSGRIGESRTGLDGTTTARARTAGVSRGDGRIEASVGAESSVRRADGSGSARSGSASGGAVAGADGYGARAATEGRASRTSANGVTTGAVGGLNARITCNVGAATGEPPRYPVDLRVELGASVGVHGGAGAGGAPGAAASSRGASLTANIAASLTMTERRMLSGAQALTYTAALQRASAGGAAASTWREMAIIRAGVTQGWAVAQEMFRNGGAPLSAQRIAALTNPGDATELAGNATESGAVSVQGAGLRGGVSASERQEFSTRVARDAHGGLDVTTHAGRTSERSVSGGIDAGVVSATATGGTRTATSRDYEITIKADRDRDGAAVRDLTACRSQRDYDAFIERYRDRITLRSRTDRAETTRSDGVEVSVAGVTAGIGSSRGVATAVTTDGSGRTREATTTGRAGTSGRLGALRDASDDSATARRTADGEASLDVANTRTATSLRRTVASVRSGNTGIIAAATGGAPADATSSRDVAGITLSTADLRRIGERARSASAWGAAVRRYQEIDDWNAARTAILRGNGEPGAVADALARFVGGDTIHRRETLELFLRPGGNTTTGRAYEFPDSLRDRRADYDRLVASTLLAELDHRAREQGNNAARDEAHRLATQADLLVGAIASARDFSRPAAKTEMMGRLADRRLELLAAERRYAGASGADAERAGQMEQVRSNLRQCRRAHAEEAALIGQMAEMLGDRNRFQQTNGDLLTAQRLLRQLRDMHAEWAPRYEETSATARRLEMPTGEFDRADLRPDRAALQRYATAAYE